MLEDKYKRINFIGGNNVKNNKPLVYDYGENFGVVEINKKASKIAGKINIEYILANFVDKNYG